jgi:hypothetical protein
LEEEKEKKKMKRRMEIRKIIGRLRKKTRQR